MLPMFYFDDAKVQLFCQYYGINFKKLWLKNHYSTFFSFFFTFFGS